MAVKCPECGSNSDLTPDKQYAHCTGCNTVFEPGKEGSSEGFPSHPDYKARDEKKPDAEDGEKKDGEAKA